MGQNALLRLGLQSTRLVPYLCMSECSGGGPNDAEQIMKKKEKANAQEEGWGIPYPTPEACMPS